MHSCCAAIGSRSYFIRMRFAKSGYLIGYSSYSTALYSYCTRVTPGPAQLKWADVFFFYLQMMSFAESNSEIVCDSKEELLQELLSIDSLSI